MNKPIVKNWMRYWASTLAISGMLVMSSCGDSERTNDNATTAPERENVTNTTVAEDDAMALDNETVTTEADNATVDQSTPKNSNATSANTNTNRWSGSSQWRGGSSVANIDRHIQKHSEVNEAIRETLSEMTEEDVNASMQQEGSQYNQNSNSANMQSSEQSGVTYDNMSNTDQQSMNNQNMNNAGAGTENQSNTSTYGNAGTTETQGTTTQDQQNGDVGTEAGEDGVAENIETSSYQTTNWGDTNTTETEENVATEVNEAANKVTSEANQAANEVESEVTEAANEVESEATQAEGEEGVAEAIKTSSYQTTNWGDTSTSEEADAKTGVETETTAGMDQTEDSTETTQNTDEQTRLYGESSVVQKTETTGSEGSVGAALGPRNNTSTQQNNASATGENMSETTQQGVTYDNMSNPDAAPQAGQYSSVYDAYLDPSMELTAEERQMIEDAKRDYEARKVTMTIVEARPDVNISELVEEIKEETKLPKELEDAKMEGTVLVKFEVDDQGAISNAEVIDGFISQTKEDGTLMSYIRLSDRTQSEIAEEINKEDLMEFKGEDRDRIIEAVSQESLRVVESTSGKWQSTQQPNATEKAVMVMPIRFDIED